MPIDSESVDPIALGDFSDLVFGYLSGAAVSAMIHLGDRLGLYRAMRGAGEVTSASLAAALGLDERWVREWLHAQASAKLVRYAGDGRYELTPAQAAVLADERHPDFAAGGFALLFPLLGSLDRVEGSFRTGRGVPYNALGREHAEGEARFSDPWMGANLVHTLLPALDGMTERLERGALVADLGCGSGSAVLAMAKEFPRSEFRGFDSSELAIGFAAERLRSSGLGNVRFHAIAADALPQDGRFELVLTFDCLHDMMDPQASARAIRGAIRDDGIWLIMDLAGEERPELNYGKPLAGFLYSLSVLDCLSCGTAAKGGAAMGTLGMPEPVARRIALEAGFTRFRRLAIENPLSAFYEVRP